MRRHTQARSHARWIVGSGVTMLVAAVMMMMMGFNRFEMIAAHL